MIVKSAKLTLVTENGTELYPTITPAKLAAIIRSCGYSVQDIDEDKCMLAEFNDKTIESNILPLLPKIKSAD